MKVLAFAIAISLIAMSAMAQGGNAPFEPGQEVRVSGISANSALNVRRGPGTSHPVASKLSAGQAGLTVLECTDAANWCRLGSARGPLGWVASRYLAAMSAEPVQPARPAFDESKRLTAVTGISLDPGGITTIPELPPYLLGKWDTDATACAQGDSKSRVTVQKNGLRIGAATARFKNAIFRNGGYDLTTLLMEEQDVLNAVPQRALYRLEPDAETLAVSGDVLEVRRLRRCGG